MENILFIFILAMIAYITYKNISLISRYRFNKKYINIYKDALNNTENCLENVDKFISNCKDLEFKNKGKILKLYVELDKGLDYLDTLESIDLKAIYYKNDKISFSNVNLNSDSFIFIMMAMARAKRVNKKDVVEKLSGKIEELTELNNNIEYLETIALKNALLEKEDKGNGLFNSLLDGTYTEHKYEKNLIGLYKRFASSTLVYNKQAIDEYFDGDLKSFSSTLIGRCYMKDLGIYDKYIQTEDKQEEKCD